MLSEIKIELNELKHFNEFYSNNLNYINDAIRILSQENTQKGFFSERSGGKEYQNHVLKIIRDLKQIETKTNKNYKILIDEVLNKLCIIKDRLIKYRSELIKSIKVINNDLYNDIENYNNLIKLMLKYQKSLEVSVIKLLRILSQENKQKELLTDKIHLVKNKIIKLGDLEKENNLYDTILQEQQILSESNLNKNVEIHRERSGNNNRFNVFFNIRIYTNFLGLSWMPSFISYLFCYSYPFFGSRYRIQRCIERDGKRAEQQGERTRDTKGIGKGNFGDGVALENDDTNSDRTFIDTTLKSNSISRMIRNINSISSNEDSNNNSSNRDRNSSSTSTGTGTSSSSKTDQDDEMKIYEIIDKSIRDNKLLNDYFFPIYYFPSNINNNNIKEQYENIDNINRILEEHENLNLRQQEIKYKCKILSKVLLNKNFSNFDNYNKYVNLLYKYDVIRNDLLLKLEEYRSEIVFKVYDFKEKFQGLERMYKGIICSIVRYYYTKHVEYYQLYCRLFDESNSNSTRGVSNSSSTDKTSTTTQNNTTNISNTSVNNENDLKNYMIWAVNNRIGSGNIVNRGDSIGRSDMVFGNRSSTISNNSKIDNIINTIDINITSRSSIRDLNDTSSLYSYSSVSSSNGSNSKKIDGNDKLGISHYVDERHNYLSSTTKIYTKINKILSNNYHRRYIDNRKEVEVKKLLNTYLTGVLSGIEGVFNQILIALMEFSDYDSFGCIDTSRSYNNFNTSRNNTIDTNSSNNTNRNDSNTDGNTSSISGICDEKHVEEVKLIDKLMERLRGTEIVFGTDNVYFLCLVYGMSRWVCDSDKSFGFEKIDKSTSGSNSSSTNKTSTTTNKLGNDINDSNSKEDRRKVYVLLQSDKYLYSTNNDVDNTSSSTRDNNGIVKGMNGKVGSKVDDKIDSKKVDRRIKGKKYRWMKNSGVMNMKNYVYYKLNLKNEIEYKIKCSLIDRIYLNGVLLLSKDQICFYSYFNSSTLFGKSTYLTIDRSDVVEIEYNGSRITSRCFSYFYDFYDIEEERSTGSNEDSNNNSSNRDRNSSSTNKKNSIDTIDINISSRSSVRDLNDTSSLYSYTSVSSSNIGGYYYKGKKNSDKKTITNRLEVIVSKGTRYRFSILYSLGDGILKFLSDFVGDLDREEYDNYDNNSSRNIRSKCDSSSTDKTSTTTQIIRNSVDKNGKSNSKEVHEMELEREKEINRIIDNVNKYIMMNKNNTDNTSSITSTGNSNNNSSTGSSNTTSSFSSNRSSGRNSISNGKSSSRNSNSSDKDSRKIFNISRNTMISTNNYNISVDKVFNILFNDMEYGERMVGNNDSDKSFGFEKDNKSSRESKENTKKEKGNKNVNKEEAEKYDRKEKETSRSGDREVELGRDKLSLIKKSKILLGSSNFMPRNQYTYNYISIIGKCMNYNDDNNGNSNTSNYNNEEKEEEVINILEDLYGSTSGRNSTTTSTGTGTRTRSISNRYGVKQESNKKINAVVVRKNLNYTINDKRILYNNSISEYSHFVFLKDRIIYQTISSLDNLPYNKCFFTLYTIVISGTTSNSGSNSSSTDKTSTTGNNSNTLSKTIVNHKNSKIGGERKIGCGITNVTVYSEIVFKKKILFNKIIKTEGMNKILYVTRVINQHLSPYATSTVVDTGVVNNRIENLDSKNKFLLIVLFVIIVMYKVFY